MVLCAVWVVTLLLLGSTFAAPTDFYEEIQNSVFIKASPPKRAALVLDRLLVALQNALHEDPATTDVEERASGEPRAAPLRTAVLYPGDMSSLQRRGQAGPGRGRVLRCYFNAITCF